MYILIFLLFVIYVDGMRYHDRCDAFFYPEGCDSKEIVFKRQTFSDDDRKEISIYVHGRSTESILIHCLLVFTDTINTYHNTLLFNPRKLVKYEKLLHFSDFPFNNEFIIIAKGSEILVQYDIASHPSPYFDGKIQYDAVLSLDYYSSMWHEYNTFVIERGTLILRMTEPVLVDSVEDFKGCYKLGCNRSVSRKYCQLNDTGYENVLHIDGRPFNYTISIRPQETHNLLPPELYNHWRYHDKKHLTIFSNHRSTPLIHLNDQFDYGVNEQSDEIILGIDVFHYLQKIEYNLEEGYYKMWYTHVYDNNSLFCTHKLIITIFIGTILSLMFYWITSKNYDILYNIVDGEMLFEYPFSQIGREILSIIIAVLLWFLSNIFSESVDRYTFYYTHSDHKRRKLLFLLFSIYNVLFMIIYLIKDYDLSSKTWRYYYRYIKRRKIIRETSQIQSKSVIMRNFYILNIMVSNLLLILNYLSEEKTFYTFLLVAISLLVIYYSFKTLLIHLIYLLSYESRNVPSTFLFCANATIFLLFLIYSIPTTYLSFLREINSMYTDVIIWTCVIGILCLVMTFSLYTVFIPLIKNKLVL